jgi:hypothetical protein
LKLFHYSIGVGNVNFSSRFLQLIGIIMGGD